MEMSKAILGTYSAKHFLAAVEDTKILICKENREAVRTYSKHEPRGGSYSTECWRKMAPW